jgi:hypothetical protein
MIDGAKNVVNVPVADYGAAPLPTVDGANGEYESSGPAAGRMGVATVTFPTDTETSEAPNEAAPVTTNSAHKSAGTPSQRRTDANETETRCGIVTPPERKGMNRRSPRPTAPGDEPGYRENHRRYAQTRSRVNP